MIGYRSQITYTDNFATHKGVSGKVERNGWEEGGGGGGGAQSWQGCDGRGVSTPNLHCLPRPRNILSVGNITEEMDRKHGGEKQVANVESEFSKGKSFTLPTREIQQHIIPPMKLPKENAFSELHLNFFDAFAPIPLPSILLSVSLTISICLSIARVSSKREGRRRMKSVQFFRKGLLNHSSY